MMIWDYSRSRVCVGEKYGELDDSECDINLSGLIADTRTCGTGKSIEQVVVVEALLVQHRAWSRKIKVKVKLG
jgi:hypothetical protein